MQRRHWLLLLLVLLAGVPRLAALGSVPPGLHPDEAVNAYEAWCLWETGRSSDGRAWPLAFVMHGRFWVEGTYVWLIWAAQVLPVSLEVAARLPAALASVALVPAVWLLGRRLLGPRAGWVAALLVALEPMAWHYGRVALRASLIPPLVAIGVALLLPLRVEVSRPRARQIGVGALAGLSLALAAVTYTPARLFVPLLGLALLVCLRRHVRREPLPFAVAGGLVALTVLATLPWSFSEAGQARFASISVFEQSDGPFAAAGAFAKGYVLHVSPRLLFWGSSSRGFWAEGVSPLLWIEAPLIVLGVGGLLARVRRGVGERGPALALVLLAWLVLYPLPGALTVPAPNPLRTLAGLPLWALLGAEGLRTLVGLARGKIAPSIVRRAVLGLVALCALAGAQAYFVRFPAREQRFWFAERSAALRRAVASAEAAGADLRVDCAWVEASLVELAGRRLRPEVERRGERARVSLTGGGEQRWEAELGDEALVVLDGAGGQVLRVPWSSD